jgi:nucleoside-triphosphatase
MDFGGQCAGSAGSAITANTDPRQASQTWRGLKLLLTGPPGIGKSTILHNAICQLNLLGRISGGVFAREVLRDGKRHSFVSVLPHGVEKEFMRKSPPGLRDGTSEPRIGSYMVDVAAIDNFVVPEIQRCTLDKSINLVYVDEIGRAQALSDAFLDTTKSLIESEKDVIGTIVEAETEWSLEYKNSERIFVISVTLENRDYLTDILVSLYNQVDLLRQLTQQQFSFVKIRLKEFIDSRNFVTAKKLLNNTLNYVVENRVTCTFRNDAQESYDVVGKTSSHTILRSLPSNRFQCDCDLSNGRGKFEACGPSVCSHELSILLFNLPEK